MLPRTLFFLLLAAVVFMPAARAVESPVETAPLVSATDALVLPGRELRSFVAARRALALAPDLAEAHIAMGYYH